MFGFIQVTVLSTKTLYSGSSLNGHSFTVLFKNKRVLKFKSQLTFAHFELSIILADILGNRCRLFKRWIALST